MHRSRRRRRRRTHAARTARSTQRVRARSADCLRLHTLNACQSHLLSAVLICKRAAFRAKGSFPRAARTGENPAESDQNAATPPPGVGTCVLRNKIEADLRFRGLWTPIRPHTRQKKLIVSAFWGCSGAVLALVETSPKKGGPKCFASWFWWMELDLSRCCTGALSVCMRPNQGMHEICICGKREARGLCSAAAAAAVCLPPRCAPHGLLARGGALAAAAAVNIFGLRPHNEHLFYTATTTARKLLRNNTPAIKLLLLLLLSHRRCRPPPPPSPAAAACRPPCARASRAAGTQRRSSVRRGSRRT